MKKLLSIFIITTTTIFLLGCEKNYTVEYWNSHKEERNSYLEKCANGDINRDSQNCENARISLSEDPTTDFFQNLHDTLKEKLKDRK
ncbi:MAG: EexN family lipoprotein [Gilliamella sp.]|uniref:EexN family lipoprotein n=1 Tax=Gilliamella sp. TaxID=1891236 RepID=UPI00260FDBD3|nr:EexN family lipoprotein [Gilliamella sp.]MCO6552994.1 EexN family lipoprotein [Gilliamella sp.]